MTPHRPLIARFWDKVKVTSGCWLWTGGTTVGYGIISKPFASIPLRAHRVAYELFIGDIPKGYHLDHLCLNKLCVNPYHLEPVTPGEHRARHSQGRTHCNKGHRLTPANTRYSNGYKQCAICYPVFALETHCKRGHEFTPENTWVSKDGKNRRYCKTCNRLRNTNKL